MMSQSHQSTHYKGKNFMYVTKGAHLRVNFAELPFTVNKSFSIFKNDLTVLSHCEVDGGVGDFQQSKMQRLARKEQKAKTTSCTGDRLKV